MDALNIATFNANSIRMRINTIKKWVKEKSIDILAIQETKVNDESFPLAEIKKIGYDVIFKGEKKYNGVAIMSKHPIKNPIYGFNGKEQTRIITGIIKGIPIVNVYIPQGKSIDHTDYVYKLNWFKELKNFLSKHFNPQDKLIVLGDMNIAPTEIDVTHPENKKKHVCYHIDVRNAFLNLLEWGLIDIFRKYNPKKGEYTFFDYRVKNALNRNIGWRIDHILATKSMAALSTNSYIDKGPRSWNKPSDHTFLVATFNLHHEK